MKENPTNRVQDFAKLWGGFRASRVILTAHNYAVFEYLRTPKTALEVAGLAGADPRAIELLLDAVTSLALLKKAGKRYRLTDIARQFLLKDSPWYQGDMLRHADFLWKTWSCLDDVVKTGMPNVSSARDNESFIRAMHNNAVFRAKEIIDSIDLRGVKKALDLGGGPGTYGRELARRGISVTLFDLPDTILTARAMENEVKSGTVDYRKGDFLSDDIGTGYDLVFISQIFHSFSIEENLILLRKSYASLNPKGKIAAQEFFLDRDRASPVSGALFSINMLVNTTSGRCYTPLEMKSWFRQAGFKGIKTTIRNDTVLVMGNK